MPPEFGTSGLRGLAHELTDELVSQYVHAFLCACPHNGKLFVGQDLRASSPRIATAIATAAQSVGVEVSGCGVVPTPALALAAMTEGAASIMVTGSHIPGHRNGLKFYTPSGEITKFQEQKIAAAAARGLKLPAGQGSIGHYTAAASSFEERYLRALPPRWLEGMKVGVFRHSSVARDVLSDVLAKLGAQVVPLGHSDTFVAVDTEAVSFEDREQIRRWFSDYHLDALVSADGDGDRPLVADEAGNIIPGDVLGILTAQFVGADTVCTPVSSNDVVRQIPQFKRVELTKIGSPHVIAAMDWVSAQSPGARVVGFEANGGFLLGFAASVPGALAPLRTRDCVLPILAVLTSARSRKITLSALCASLPQWFTASGRLQEIARSDAADFLERLRAGGQAFRDFFKEGAGVRHTDDTDGLRVEFENSSIVHLRPSGNAPEFRVYAQARSREQADALVDRYLARVSAEMAS